MGAGFSGVALVERLAFQLPGGRLLDVHSSHGAHFGAQRRGPEDYPILSRSPAELAILNALYQNLHGSSQPAPIRSLCNPPLRVQQHVDAALLFCLRDIVRLPGGRGPRPRRKALNMYDVELDLLEQVERALELLLGLARVANDHVR